MAKNTNKEEVILDFKHNADGAKKSVDGLSKSVDKTVDSSEKLDKTNEKVSKSQKKVSSSTKQQKAGLEDLGGGFGAAISGAKGLLKQFALMLANPIILVITGIVAAVTLLFKAFTSTKAGSEQLDRIMAGLGSTLDVLRDRFLKITEVVKKLFSGDIKGSIREFVGIFKGAGEEIAREFDIAAESVRNLQEVADASRDLSVARSELNVKLAESKRIIEDENASIADKKKAIDEVRIAEGKQTEQELANAKKKLEAIRAENKQSDSGAVALQKEADAEIAYNNLLLKSSQDRTTLLRIERRASKEAEAQAKQIATERKARDKERSDREKSAAKQRQALRDAERKAIEDFNKSIVDKELALQLRLEDLKDDSAQKKLDRQKERNKAELDLLEKKGVDTVKLTRLNAEIFAIAQAEIDADIQVKKDEAKALEDQKKEDLRAKEEAAKEEARKAEEARELALVKAKKDLGNQGVAAAKDLFAKNKKVQKGIIVAEGAVALGKVGKNTVESVSQAVAASPLTFGAPWSPILAAQGALNAASIISSTQKALQSLGGGGGSIGASPSPPIIRGASAQPQTGFQPSRENQIANSINQSQEEQAPIKAYVVTSDITKGQDLDAKIISENSFG